MSQRAASAIAPFSPGARGSFRRLRGRASSRGQALLIAVLVLFAVATLAALFTGLVGAQLSQVARQSDVVALRGIAEAGLRLANESLTYSPQGADWRPSDRPYVCGNGRVSVTVSYGPAPDQLQSRFLRILATAAYPDNPFLRHSILALKPVLLTDYARFITDLHETNRPAALGVAGVRLGGRQRLDYLYSIEGPIRSNTDIIWYGRSQVGLRTSFDETADWLALGILRDDRIEVAGRMRPAPLATAEEVLSLWIDGQPRASHLFDPQTEDERFGYVEGFPRVWNEAIIPNSRTVLAQLPDLTTLRGELIASALAVPRVRPPQIDAIHPDKETQRYLLLTRDSGSWRQNPDTLLYHNTGEHGWGWAGLGGIYIDNGPYVAEDGRREPGDIQYNHDLDKLRLNWTRSVGAHSPLGDHRDSETAPPLAGPADWWDRSDRYYAPPGVEIVLHGDAPCPYVEIIRHDYKMMGGEGFYWRDPDGIPILSGVSPPRQDLISYQYLPGPGMCTPPAGPQPVGIYDGNRAIFPFPANGVIYAEGNIRIRGIMPPVRDNRGRSGAEIPAAEVPLGYLGQWDPAHGRSRRFDLQVVSGGTIYIEGDLLNPSQAYLSGLTPYGSVDDATYYRNDALYGSRIALLARDSVCVNTTALNPRPANALAPVIDPDTGEAAWYNDGQHVYPPGTASLRYGIAQGQDTTVAEWGGDLVPAVPPVLDFMYHNVRLRNVVLRQEVAAQAPLRLLLGHTGSYVQGFDPETGAGIPTLLDNPEAYVEVSLSLNGTALPWEAAGSYRFLTSPAGANQSNRWFEEPTIAQLEFLPDATMRMELDALLMTGTDTFEFGVGVMPVPSRDGDNGPIDPWIVYPKDLGYLLGPIAVAPPNRDPASGLTPAPLPVEINALVYAQNGSWFIIPGPWFNDDEDNTGYTTPYPSYHEPLNIKIGFYGAITENMPADPGSVADWTSKWGGPAGAGEDGFLWYAYDPLLRYPRRETAQGIGYLRFPNFPLTPDLVVWGERVSGPAGG